MLEQALEVARQGQRAKPPVPPPRALARLMAFKQMSGAALTAVMGALDRDAEFRGRVAGAVTKEQVGRAGWLFVARPDGWQEELAASTGHGQPDRNDPEPPARKAEPDPSARIRRAEEQRRRAESERDKARAALAAEKEKSRGLADRLRDETRAATALRREAEDSRSRAEEIAGRLERAEAELDRRDAGADLTKPLGQAARHLARLRRALDDAGAATAEVGGVLDRLGGERPPDRPEPVRPRGKAERLPTSGARTRRPSTLPPGLRGDSHQAASHLVGRGTVVLVDGYNVSMRLWPGVAGIEQRSRLVDALTEMAARTGAEPWVVFDSSDGSLAEAGIRHRASARATVKVRFSPPDMEADDVILELCDQIPAVRTVVVASDDRRVREGAEERGANVIGVDQLAHLVRR